MLDVVPLVRPARRTLERALPVRVLSALLLLAVWELTARLVGSRLLPPASVVLETLAARIADGTLAADLGVTLVRVACAFALSMVAGSALGLAMGWWRRVDLLFDTALIALLNMPALVTIALLYVWFGLTDASAIVAVALNKLPGTAVTVREGTRALDRDLGDMAYSFRFPALTMLRHVVLPQLAPYLFAASRSGLSLIWKIVLVAELLGLSDGVGFRIGVYFQLFDVTGMLAYTLAFMAVIQALEWAVLQPLERHSRRWR
jgi:NitT/TauT family transport system permease protein